MVIWCGSAPHHLYPPPTAADSAYRFVQVLERLDHGKALASEEAMAWHHFASNGACCLFLLNTNLNNLQGKIS